MTTGGLRAVHSHFFHFILKTKYFIWVLNENEFYMKKILTVHPFFNFILKNLSERCRLLTSRIRPRASRCLALFLHVPTNGLMNAKIFHISACWVLQASQWGVREQVFAAQTGMYWVECESLNALLHVPIPERRFSFLCTLDSKT